MSGMTAAAILAGKVVFKKTVTDIYGYCREKTGKTLKQWNTERQIETLYRRIAQVRKVKTIWQVDKAVDLTGFYCDSHVIIARKRIKIVQLADFGLKDNILIQGIAGQGKSILLRYLCTVELARGEVIPLFLELRRITQETSLMERIRSSFLSLGLSVDDELFHALASSGKIVLFLDAFDEVADELKGKVLTDIEDLAARHEALRIVVTSRPYHNIQMSNHFTVVTLDNLQGDEYAQVIRKLAGGQAWAQQLIKHIDSKATHIRPLLCTPLMVTLLVLSYKSYQKLPAKLSDFYDALFQTLLQRHDGTKPGFARQRGCSLDDNEYRQVFEALCILAKKQGQQSFNSPAITQIAKEAISHSGFKANAATFVDDIVKITCLIIRDGEEHRFIHKTVQEYYTASFVQRKPDIWVKDFYLRLLNKGHSDWIQELSFLEEIDSYRYSRFFRLPAILAFLNVPEANLDLPLPSVSADWLRETLRPLYVNLKKLQRDTIAYAFLLSGQTPSPIGTDFLQHVMRVGPWRTIADTEPKELTRTLEKHNPSMSRLEALPGKVYSVSEALDDKGVLTEMRIVADQYRKKLQQEARQLRTTLEGMESKSLLDGLV